MIIFKKILAVLVTGALAACFCGCQDISQRTIDSEASTEKSDFSGVGGDLLPSASSDETDRGVPPAGQDFSPTQQEFISTCLFMGDSLCYGLDSYGLVDSCFAKAGVAARNIEEYTFTSGDSEVSPLTALVNSGSKNFVFLMGTNDVNIESSDQYIEFYDSFLKKVEAMCPDASIYVLSIPPVTENSDFCYNYTIDEFNLKLKNMVSESGTASRHYIDITSGLRDERGALKEAYALSDGVHLTKSAYYVLLGDFCSGVGVS